ncbi:MAG: hypothetical protein J6B81_00050 [Spirochaetaceae bacterium]|nr:hypothetical protein [Spirochaetaceae bacterium]
MAKKIISVMFLLSVCASFAFTQELPSTDKISEGLNDFSIELLNVVPNTAVQQGVWSDAYIGKLIPSVPPHLGGGLTVGIAQLDPAGLNIAIGELNKMVSLGGEEIPSLPDSIVLPTLTADLRIGGLFLPFDLGISVMKIPSISFDMFGAGTSIDFFTIGGSLRVPVMQGNVILPKLSIGAGLMYSKGSIGAYVEDDNAFVNTSFDTKTAFLEAQLSKKILILTPFVGFRGIISESENKWGWKYNISFAGYTAGDEETGTVSRSYKDDFKENFQYQLYGGLSLDILIIRTTVSASYDFKNSIWGGNLSLRIQI